MVNLESILEEVINGDYDELHLKRETCEKLRQEIRNAKRRWFVAGYLDACRYIPVTDHVKREATIRSTKALPQ